MSNLNVAFICDRVGDKVMMRGLRHGKLYENEGNYTLAVVDASVLREPDNEAFWLRTTKRARMGHHSSPVHVWNLAVRGKSADKVPTRMIRTYKE